MESSEQPTTANAITKRYPYTTNTYSNTRTNMSNTIPVHDQHNRKPELQSKARNTKSYHSQMNLPYNTKQRLGIYTKFTTAKRKIKRSQ